MKHRFGEFSLEDLPNITEQQVYDQVLAHARKQGEKSESDSDLRNTCYYRKEVPSAGKTLACFAGSLISDSEYIPQFDNPGPEVANSGWPAITSHFNLPSNHMDLISSLQKLHDQYPVAGWERRFQEVAHNYGLHYTAPDANKL